MHHSNFMTMLSCDELLSEDGEETVLDVDEVFCEEGCTAVSLNSQKASERNDEQLNLIDRGGRRRHLSDCVDSLGDNDLFQQDSRLILSLSPPASASVRTTVDAGGMTAIRLQQGNDDGYYSSSNISKSVGTSVDSNISSCSLFSNETGTSYNCRPLWLRYSHVGSSGVHVRGRMGSEPCADSAELLNAVERMQINRRRSGDIICRSSSSSSSSSTVIADEQVFQFMFDDSAVRPNVADSTDSLPLQYNMPPNIHSEQQSAKFKRSEAACVAVAPVDRDADCYRMDHKRRGVAVILNHDRFAADYLPPRHGSDKDVLNLRTSLARFKFDVRVYNNLTKHNIHRLLYELTCTEDHSDADCLLIVLLTHGLSMNLVWAYDQPYDVDSLWTAFCPAKCPSLAGKPKLLFVQACRGEQLDSGVKLMSSLNTETDGNEICQAYTIPSFADFMIVYGTTAGMYSYRNQERGTWFAESLCAELDAYTCECSLTDFMTRVARRVAIFYESFNVNNPSLCGNKQVPIVHSTLIRILRLPVPGEPVQHVPVSATAATVHSVSVSATSAALDNTHQPLDIVVNETSVQSTT